MNRRHWLVLLGAAALIALVLLALSLFATKDKAQAPGEIEALAYGSVVIDFTGSPVTRGPATATFAMAPGQTAWYVLQQVIGTNNLTYEDFGGNLGVFVSGFYGVKAEGNHFWEFNVNGKPSDVGVSGYLVKDGDVLEFRYASY